MKILVTGAQGFVGKNLCAQLKNIRDGKARNYGLVMPGSVRASQFCYCSPRSVFAGLTGNLKKKTIEPHMTQDELWLKKYQEVKDFIETNHRNPSRYDPEERGKYCNWIKHKKSN